MLDKGREKIKYKCCSYRACHGSRWQDRTDGTGLPMPVCTGRCPMDDRQAREHNNDVNA